MTRDWVTEMSHAETYPLTPELARCAIFGSGRVSVFHAGEFFRAVYPNRAGFLVPCRIEKEIEDEGYGLIVWHEHQPFEVTSSELCRVQALD